MYLGFYSAFYVKKKKKQKLTNSFFLEVKERKEDYTGFFFIYIQDINLIVVIAKQIISIF